MRVGYETPDHLLVNCAKCTREERVKGKTEAQASMIAEALGWRHTAYGMVCPKCPGGGRPRLDLAQAAANADPAIFEPQEQPA